MNCQDFYPLIHAYADGELDLMRSLDVERHLEDCPGCAQEKRSIESLRAGLRGGRLSFTAPPGLVRRIRRTLPGAGSTGPRGVKVFWQWLACGATAFAVVLLLLRPSANSESALADEAIGNHVRSLMAAHLTDVASTDQHTVRPWFNGRVDFAPEVKDFAAQGFPLIGGRLDYLKGQPVAALVYQHQKHVINVFVWPARRPLGNEPDTRRGYSLVHRDLNGLHYYLVSDLNPTELRAFGQMLE